MGKQDTKKESIMLKHYPLLTNRKTWEKHPHTLPILIYCTTIQPCINYRQKNKAISLACFTALPEYRKMFKYMLLLDWCYNAESSTQILRQVNLLPILLLWLNSKVWEEHFTIWLWWITVRSFSHMLSKLYFPSEWYSIFLFSAVCEGLALFLWLHY